MASEQLEQVATLTVDPRVATVYCEGWQSWSPTRIRALADAPANPTDAEVLRLGYRIDRPPVGHQGEGLLAIHPGNGQPVEVFAVARLPLPAMDPQVPTIRATLAGDQVTIWADGPVTRTTWIAPDLQSALTRWADATVTGMPTLRQPPPMWCSWYQYYTGVTQADILENLHGFATHDLPVEVVQIDDGYQAEIGDWLTPSDRFESLTGLVGQIQSEGRRAGIWVAPFLVGSRSQLAKDHPDWLVGGAVAGHNWDQELGVLDVTHPAAAAHLAEVFARMREWGFDFYKIDFCYAGAQEGARHDPRVSSVAAYRRGLELIRASIGPQAYLLGCGAPTIASVGLVDAMRISPDTALYPDVPTDDPSKPGLGNAMANGVARAWQQGRFWINDPDCILARPELGRRAQWADHVRTFGGLRATSDRVAALDDWGLTTTRELLSLVPAAAPFGT